MKTNRLYIYTPYERIWHWLQSAGILLLVFTGLVIHWPDAFGVIGFSTAVEIHNVLGFLLLANAFLGLFYYVTTGTIRRYMPEPRDFISLSVRQAQYYLSGMLRGESHPLHKTPQRPLNPLQQMTYLAILNVLLPLQIVTGLLIWGAQRWPAAVGAVGGLPVLAMIHTLGAWLFVSFIVAHIYLITTGPTLLSHLKAMIVGYEDVPVQETAAAVGPGEEDVSREPRSSEG